MNNFDFSEFLFEKNRNKKKNCFVPNKKKSEYFIDKLFHILFIPDPILLENKFLFKKNYENLKNILYEIFIDLNISTKKSKNLSNVFFQKIPDIYNLLIIDAKSIFNSDPAATSVEEIISTYPGFFSISLYRIAHQLWIQNVPIIPRLITEYAHGKTGIDIHASSEIGNSFSIDHGTGIVIGSSTKIGNNVKIYQGVTLGAIYVDKNLTNVKRHPTIEDMVTIYSGTTILGGDTVIGHNSIIGGNVWITKSIPPYSIVYQKSEIKMKNNNSCSKNPIDFII